MENNNPNKKNNKKRYYHHHNKKKNKREEHGRGIFHIRVSSKIGNMKSHSKHY